MKKIFSILFILILYINGFGQSVVPRSNSSITVQDSRWQAQYNLFTPRYADTTAANLQKGIDSLGAIIYTYDVQSFWGRQYSGGKKWVALGSGGGGGSGTVTNIATGLGLSGGPITTTGTLLVDTASASILSRQRAALTYAPISINGTVTSVARTNGLGITASVANPSTTPNITIAVDTSDASILSRQRAAATYALIGDVVNPFLPVSGTGTATGAIIGDLSGNSLNIESSGISYLTIDAPSFSSSFLANDGTATSGLINTADLIGNNVNFSLSSTNGSSTVSIAGNPIANTITYTADTHIWNGNFKSGTANSWDLDGHEITIENLGRHLLRIDPSPGGEASELRAYNETDDDNVASFSAETSNTQAASSIVSRFNGSVKISNIYLFTDATTSTIDYSADTHSFTGNVLPSTDNTYSLGDATHRWTELHVMGSSIKMYGSSSGVITIGTQAASGTFNWNLPTSAGTSGQPLLSGGGGASAMTFGTLGATVGGTGLTGGTSGGINYWSSSTTMASSAALAANALVIGGGAGVAPSTTTTASGILTFLGTPSSANLLAALTDETGTGKAVFATSPTFTTSILLAGSTSGNVTFASDALSNAPNITTLSGTGFGSATMLSRLTSSNNMSDVNTVQSPFPKSGDVWTLQGSTTYYFEGFYYLTHGATSHSVGMSFELAGGASVTSINYTVLAWPNVTAGTTTTTQTTTYVNVATNTAINSAGANGAETIRFWGYLSMNAGGTVTPSITFSAAPGGAPASGVGTYITFTPIGTNTITTLGNVN